jgi:hypothetical protein
MITSPSTWKAFIANHPLNGDTNILFSLVNEAFDKEHSISDCTNAALGVTPEISLVFPIDAERPILIHHMSKAFRIPAIHNDTDEFFGLISWDDRELAMKLDPANLFELAGDGTLDEQARKLEEVLQECGYQAATHSERLKILWGSD